MNNQLHFPRSIAARCLRNREAFQTERVERGFSCMTYAEKLKDPRWQKKRLETFEAHGWKCDSCLTRINTLHVHHRYYVPGRQPWEYPVDCLQVLCSKCHKDTHHVDEDEDRGAEEWEVFLATLRAFEEGPFSLCICAYNANTLVEEHGIAPHEIINAIEVFLKDPDAVRGAVEKYWSRY